jgi:peptidoglycan hydrolase CwlO-like protein
MIDLLEILTFVGGLMVSIIGYFLKRTMDELKDVKQITYKNQTKIEVMETRFSNIDEKMDDLKEAVKELTQEIKQLNLRTKN